MLDVVKDLIRAPPEYLASDVPDVETLPWFMRRDWRRDMRYKALSAPLRRQADRFMRDGYIIFRNDAPDDVVARTLAAFKDFTARHADYFDPFRDENGYLSRVVNLHLALPALIELFASARAALAFQDALYGRTTTMYTTLYFERGSAQTLHRDTPYFTTRPEYSYFGMWIALEPADPGNGCLEVLPGGHLMPELDRAAFGRRHFGDLDALPTVPGALFDLYQSTVLEAGRRRGLSPIRTPMGTGDVLIWHPQLPHGGAPIAQGARTRNSLVIHTVPEGVPVYQADAFFNPTRDLPVEIGWRMLEAYGRRYALHAHVDVMHQAPRTPESFFEPDQAPVSAPTT